MTPSIALDDSKRAPRTVAACVLSGHEMPANDRQGCPLVRALVQRVATLGIVDDPDLLGRELDKYRAVSRVLDCPLIARLGVQDLHALVAARQVRTRPQAAA